MEGSQRKPKRMPAVTSVYQDLLSKDKMSNMYAYWFAIISFIKIPVNELHLDGYLMRTAKFLRDAFPNLTMCVPEYNHRVYKKQLAMGIAECVYGTLNSFLSANPDYIADCNCAYLDYMCTIRGSGDCRPCDDILILLNGTKSRRFVLGLTVSARLRKHGELNADVHARKKYLNPLLAKAGWRSRWPTYIHKYTGANGQHMIFYSYKLERI